MILESCIVIQGLHYGDDTRTVIRQFMSKNPNILIIISTYEESKTMLDDWEKYLAIDGKLVYIFSHPPARTEEAFWNSNFANQNLQRLTSCVGLKYAEKLGFKYCLKIRSDSFLGKDHVIDYLKESVLSYPLLSCRIRPTGRIVVGSHATISHPEMEPDFAPFHIRDHWYFGYTEDLIGFFDLDSPTWNKGRGIDRCSPESSLTRVWMADLKINDSYTIRDLLGKYFIVEDFHFIEQCRTHVIAPDQQRWIVDMEAYRLGRADYLRQFLILLQDERISTTREQWDKMRIDVSKE